MYRSSIVQSHRATTHVMQNQYHVNIYPHRRLHSGSHHRLVQNHQSSCISRLNEKKNIPNERMPLTQQARSAYRALLREHPRRNLLQSTSTSASTSPGPSTTPLHNHLRKMFRNEGETASPAKQEAEISDAERQRGLQRIQEAQQFAQYAKAQRTYTSLLEMYFPGMTMDEEEKIRLTARRVGWDLPVTGSEGQ